jgi:hypothetical protein
LVYSITLLIHGSYCAKMTRLSFPNSFILFL